MKSSSKWRSGSIDGDTISDGVWRAFNGLASNLEIHFLREKCMDAAFDFVETGPAPGALVFPGGNSLSARLATDRAITLIVQRIVRDLVLAQIIPDCIARPVGHRIEFHNVAAGILVEGIDFQDADASASIRLLAA